MATARFPVEIRGANGTARRFIRLADRLEDELQRELRGLGEDAELIFAAHALRRSGRMARNITSEVRPGGITVKVEAKNPETGYDYVGVTRFGHRTRRIVPKNAKALRWTTRSGRVVFAASSPGFHPSKDWRDEALPQINREVSNAETRLGRRIEGIF